MTCFIQESPLDFLIYYPITKILDERKSPFVVYDVSEKSSIDFIHFLSKNPTIKTIVNYGFGIKKLQIAILSKEYELLFINLHSEERDSTSIPDVLTSLASHNYVVSRASVAFLREGGIQTPVNVFECPITSLSRKSKKDQTVDVVYIGSNRPAMENHVTGLRERRYNVRAYDYSNGQPDNWAGIYKDIFNAKFVVSDSWVFDKPSRFLNKHFFFIGENVLSTSNLGKSAHLVDKKLELHDYLKQSWSKLEDINQRHGLQSLIMNLG